MLSKCLSLKLCCVIRQAKAVYLILIKGVEIDKEFRTLKEKLQETRDIVIQHGPVLSDYVIVPKPKKKPSKC